MGIQVRSHSIRPALTIALALVAGLLVFVAQAAAAPPAPVTRAWGPAVPDARERRLRRPPLQPRLDLSHRRAAPDGQRRGHHDRSGGQSLSSFSLDFADGTVSDVDVDRRNADFVLEGGELVVTPARALSRARSFPRQGRVHGRPRRAGGHARSRWFTTVDGSVTAGQPDLGYTIYPVNDHPADKATYTIKVDALRALPRVASGVLRGTALRPAGRLAVRDGRADGLRAHPGCRGRPTRDRPWPNPRCRHS